MLKVFSAARQVLFTVLGGIVCDCFRFTHGRCRSRTALAAENLFLRRPTPLVYRTKASGAQVDKLPHSAGDNVR